MNNSTIIIRRETTEDYRKTDYMILRAFWNLHGPGCNEHYLAHILRKNASYVPKLSLVAEQEGEIVGAILFFRATVVDGDTVHPVLSFGPLCVEPTLHNTGIGARLMKESFQLAREAGYPGIVIFGEPDYYPRHGFQTCDHYGITTADGANFAPFMAYALDAEAFSNIHGRFIEPDVVGMSEDMEKAAAYTKEFPYHKPLKLACQWLHEERLGRICQIQKNTFVIRFWEKEYPAKLKGTFGREQADLPVVGDYVTFLLNPSGDSVITSVCERTSEWKRPDQSGHAISYVKTMQEQVMVANFDYVFIVSSLNDNYNYNRIARYVSITLQGNACPVVILTKADLCTNPGRYVREIEELSEHVRVHTISALYGIGVDELKEYLVPGTTIAILGSSGVGKSTLVNALAGREVMKTSDIREEDSKGRHTTTHRQMIDLGDEIYLIDTPGMRELGMCDVEEGIDETFSDIVELAGSCRFHDCKHETEPGCAVKAALQNGTLSQERFALYCSLQEESSHAARMKAIAKNRKNYKKYGSKH